MALRPRTHRPSRSRTPRHTPAEQQRRTSTQRGYGYRWQQTRIGFLKSHPLCAECERQGRVRQANEVDHIIPHKGDMDLFWDRDNWQPMCAPCHSRKTATEDGGFGRPVRTRQ